MTQIQPRPVTAAAAGTVEPDRTAIRRSFDLNGEWAFVPREIELGDLAAAAHEPIRVPGLWEAQGWVDLDGAAWYLRHLDLEEVSGHWTLHFGAVMDEAEVFVNREHVGRHVGSYTPFALDVSEALQAGRNELAVRVLDPRAGSATHVRSAHGKQGWKNDVFPSPPSLYLTYGGIWQPVELTQHGPVTVEDVFVNGDPSHPLVRIRLRNRAAAVPVVVELEIADRIVREDVVSTPGDLELELHPGLDGLARWSPDDPALHLARVRLFDGDSLEDEAEVRFGIRSVAVKGKRIVLNGRPVRMQAALVQGFGAETLYAEGARAEIEREVGAAKAIGLNTLRLHIKAFDPLYLDVCDELGMLVHCDLPIAEPIEVSELDDAGLLPETCAAAAAEQIVRDRNHPSIVLWSAMNEIGAEDESLDVRATAGYTRFARLLYRLLIELDGTRPIIENDYVEPSPEYVYESPVLTAHWYGRLSRTYLSELHRKTEAWSSAAEKVLLVSEFGEWALPSLPDAPVSAQPFWAPEALTKDICDLPWPGTPDEFVAGTQMYKGIADRLQIELFRRAPGVGGWCLTELTDVPHEYNGLWELDRTPKLPAIESVGAACASTLPMLLHLSRGDLGGWNGWAGEEMELSFVAAHDEDDGAVATATVQIGGSRVSFEAALDPHLPTAPSPVTIVLPSAAGTHELTATLTAATGPYAANAYSVHVFERPARTPDVSAIGSPADVHALTAAGARLGDEGILVVGETVEMAEARESIETALRAGRTVLVLAQPSESAAHLPIPAAAADLRTQWGSLPYFFSTDEACLAAVPARTIVTTELLSVTPTVVYTRLGQDVWPAQLVLGMYKPAPDALAATVIGSLPVYAGRLWVCQLPLVEAALADDATAIRTLADLLQAAAEEAA